MPAYPKPEPRPKKRSAFGSTLATPKTPMRKHSLTNAGAVAWREDYLPARERYLKAHPYCEMNITTPAICPRAQHPATEIQHMVQRSLDPSIENLLDESHWIPSCHKANAWCGIHPIEAIALGVELDPRAVTEQEESRS